MIYSLFEYLMKKKKYYKNKKYINQFFKMFQQTNKQANNGFTSSISKVSILIEYPIIYTIFFWKKVNHYMKIKLLFSMPKAQFRKKTIEIVVLLLLLFIIYRK